MWFPYDRPDRLGRPSRFKNIVTRSERLRRLLFSIIWVWIICEPCKPCKPREKIEFYEIVNAMGMWGFAAGILFAELRSIGRLHWLGLSAQFKHSLYGLGFKALFRIKHSFTTVIPFRYAIFFILVVFRFLFCLTWPLLESEITFDTHYPQGGLLPRILDRGVPRRFMNPNPI